MGDRSFGARWWRESLGLARWASKPAVGTMGLLGALALPACATTWAGQEGPSYADSHDELDVSVDALQLQRNEGWDVGQWGTPLSFAGSSDVDAAGTQAWRDAMANLAVTMAPPPALQPFYVPTLYQSLIGPDGQRLRAVMRPMHTPDMDEDLARGIALRAQFGGVNWPKDTALIIDAPGPRAVAVAAALSDRFAPVFMFGNWPHPLGVVPAHQTIAASLYYLPMFAAAGGVRAPDAPPMFVLDANRLAPYAGGAGQFDNRYFVKLPSAEQLAALGVRHVLYVGADGAAGELDDLNAALVAMCGKGVDVKMLALSDFVRAGDEPQLATGDEPGEEGDGDGDEGAVAPDPAWTWAFMWSRPAWLWAHYWYRGCWWDSPFWGDYGWYPGGHGVGRIVPRGRGAIVVGPPTGHRAPPLGSRAAWSPRARSTMFTPSVGNARSAAFGQVSVRAARSDGHIVSMGSSTFTGGNGSGHSMGWGARAGGAGSGLSSAGHAGFHSTVGGGFGGGAVGRSSGFGSRSVSGGGGGGRSGSLGRAGGTSFGGG